VTGLEIRIVVYGLVLIALVGGGWYIHDRLQAADEAETALSGANAQAGATAATTDALSGVQTETQRVEVVVTQTRADIARAVKELSNADPTVADLRARPIPDGLRELARARREARDRAAGAAAGGAGPDRAAGPGG
jgi:hypothetical protein